MQLLSEKLNGIFLSNPQSPLKVILFRAHLQTDSFQLWCRIQKGNLTLTNTTKGCESILHRGFSHSTKSEQWWYRQLLVVSWTPEVPAQSSSLFVRSAWDCSYVQPYKHPDEKPWSWRCLLCHRLNFQGLPLCAQKEIFSLLVIREENMTDR